MSEYPDPEQRAPIYPGCAPAKAELLVSYARKVETHLQQDPNLVDQRLDYPGNTVRVYYAGVTPASLDPLGQAARTEGVRIEVVRVRFAPVKLYEVERTLFKALRASGIEFHSIGEGTPADGPGSGLTVAVPALDAHVTETIGAIAATAVRGIPVVVVKSKGRATPAASVDQTGLSPARP